MIEKCLCDSSQKVAHLDALHFEDEVGNDLRDVSLVEHGVSDALQQRLHRGHTVHHDPATQEAVVELQVDQTWTHLEDHNMQTTGEVLIDYRERGLKEQWMDGVLW